MAEAAVISRYFCHQCSQETTSVLPDYTCPRCHSGFIEMIREEEEDSTNSSVFIEEDQDISQMSRPYDRQVPPMADILDLYGQFSGSRHASPSNGVSTPNSSTNVSDSPNNTSNGESTRTRTRARYSSDNSQLSPNRSRTRYFQFNFPRGSDAVGFDNQQTLEGLFQHILTNVASGQNMGGRDAGRGLINIDFPLPLFQVLHGNPGDYAWGSGGLDVVITQLLNQLDGTGPPPMPKEEIEKLPFVAITGEQVSKNLQCTVCMEDFKYGEKVISLMCTHCYHKDCIIPWLQMHATCPVCRKELSSNRIVNQSSNNYNSRGPTSTSTNANTGSQFQSENPITNQSTSNTSSYEFTEDYD